MSRNRFAAGVSTAPQAAAAARQAGRAAATGRDVDLALLFLSSAHVESAGEAAEALHEELRPRRLVGCVAEGVVGGERELEAGPALAVWAASLPNGGVETFHAHVELTDEGPAIVGVPDLDDDPSLVLLLVDPFSFPADAFLDALNAEHPGLPLVGGIAAGGGRPGAQALVVDNELYESGAAGAVLRGVTVETVVSQGCAPIGREAVITAAERNVVLELAGQPALDRLREDLEALPPEQRQLAAQGILAGIVIDENRAEYGRGDFLMRGVLGVDEGSSGLVIGAPVRVGQTVRFHVRDAESADADLRAALDGVHGDGVLLFTCNGRGTHMFGAPDHDARLVSERVGTPAVAGFFCGGEIGPVGDQAFLHGFTATLAVFLGE